MDLVPLSPTAFEWSLDNVPNFLRNGCGLWEGACAWTSNRPWTAELERDSGCGLGRTVAESGYFDLTLVMGHPEFGIFGRFGNSRSSLVRLIEVLYVHLSFLFFLYLHLLGNKRSPRAQLCSVSYIT